MAFNTLAWKLWGLSVLALALKMLVLALLTSRQRFQKNVFASPEDYAALRLQTQDYLRSAMPHRTIAYGYGYFATLWMILASARSLLS